MITHPRPQPSLLDPESGRSLGALFQDLSAQTSRLLRQETRLARTELSRRLSEASGELARAGIGVGIAAAGALAVVGGAVLALGHLLGSFWLSALTIGLVLVAAGAWSALRAARSLRGVDLAPRRALQSLHSTREWARHEIAGVRSTLLGAPGKDHGSSPAALPTSRSATSVSPPTRAVEAPPRGGPRTGRTGSPPEPPPHEAGLLAFLKHVGREIGEDDVMGNAAKLAYYAFLAMPPALMATFGLAGLVGSGTFAAWLERQAALVMPAEVTDSIIRPFVEEVVLNEAPGPFSIGLLLALWGGSAVFAGLMDSLNAAYDVEESRPFVKKRAIAVGVMLGGSLLFILAAVALLAGPELAEAVRLGGAATLAWSVIRWPLTFAFVVAAFWLGYYILPNRDQRACKRVLLKAAAAAALLWVLATGAFRIYIANFSSYSETYGFLGAFIILLLWLYMTGLVVLAGGELASEMEKRS